jgi:predicted dienelactone hydrolase
VPDAEPVLSVRAPLIVLVHGSGGSADSMAWIALGLVRELGALVVAADHPGSSGGDPERASMLEVWQQPSDVTVLLNDILVGEWARHVDAERISVVGFSLGGGAALSLAGARLRFERFPAFCAEHDDGACRAFAQHLHNLDTAFFRRSNADLSDSRVQRAVAIAPGFTESLTTESVAQLSTPVLIIVGARDQQLPPATHVEPIRAYIPSHSRILKMDDAQHFSFLPQCREDAAVVLAETNEEFVCEELGEKSREEIHAATIAAIAAFLTAD